MYGVYGVYGVEGFWVADASGLPMVRDNRIDGCVGCV